MHACNRSLQCARTHAAESRLREQRELRFCGVRCEPMAMPWICLLFLGSPSIILDRGMQRNCACNLNKSPYPTQRPADNTFHIKLTYNAGPV